MSGYRGQLEVLVRDRDGNVYVYDTPNLITYDARVACAHMLVGDTTHQVNKFAVGTGSTAPQRTDSGLEAEIYNTTGFTLTFPGAPVGQVQFAVVLGYSHPTDGSTLREVGLFTQNNLLVARQVHAPIAKNSMFQVEYRWRIVFT